MRKARGVMLWSMVLLLALLLIGSSAYGQSAINMEFRDAPLTDVYQILGEIGGYNVLLDPSVAGNVSFYLKDLTVPEALDLVSRTTGYGYTIMENTLIVANPERLKQEFGKDEFVFVNLKNVNVSDARQLLSMVVPGVNVFADAGRGLIVIYGSSADIELAERIVSQYDERYVAPETPAQVAEVAKEETLRSFQVEIEYAEGEDILSLVGRLYPNREFHWDANLRTLIGRTSYSEWEEVVELVYERDVPSFDIRGIVSGGEQVLVLVDYRGATQLVAKDQVIHGWTLTNIAERAVTFEKDGRALTVQMGR